MRLAGFGPFLLVSLLALLAICGLPEAAEAQIRASERARVMQTVDGTEITVDYARPRARGRSPLFGGVVPWDEVWTPGANENTTIRFSRDVELDGHPVQAGLYGVWIQIREEDPWLFLLHPDTARFHTEHPEVEEGVLVFEMEPRTDADFTEVLTFSFPDIRVTGTTLAFAWGSWALDWEIAVESTISLTVPEPEAVAIAGEWELAWPDNEPGDGSIIELEYEAGEERLVGNWSFFGDTRMTMVRQAEGVYQLGYFIGDEVADIIPLYIEFFDERAGRWEAFEARDPDDEVVFSGSRTGG